MIVNGWKLLTIITKSSTLDVAAVLDPTLVELIQNYQKQKKACQSFKPCQIDLGNSVSYKMVSNNWLWIFFCGVVDWRKAQGLIFSRDNCQRFSSWQISNTLAAWFEPTQNYISGFAEWGCAAVTTRDHDIIQIPESF